MTRIDWEKDRRSRLAGGKPGGQRFLLGRRESDATKQCRKALLLALKGQDQWLPTEDTVFDRSDTLALLVGEKVLVTVSAKEMAGRLRTKVRAMAKRLGIDAIVEVDWVGGAWGVRVAPRAELDQ